MITRDIKVRSAGGGEFDCYLAAPGAGAPLSAFVLASAIHGVDASLRGIADDLAARGYIAAAPDLFWRTTPGPLPRGDARAAARAQPRLEKIKAGEQDFVDVLRALNTLSFFNGRAAVIGFCYGGPYAILGPKRLGYEAGLACHGSQLGDYVSEVADVTRPVCIVWGDQDHLAPAAVRDAYSAVSLCKSNVVVHVLPDVRHGFTMKGTAAFDRDACAFCLDLAATLLP